MSGFAESDLSQAGLPNNFRCTIPAGSQICFDTATWCSIRPSTASNASQPLHMCLSENLRWAFWQAYLDAQLGD